MTPEEKFKFDLEGYLVVKNVLTPHGLNHMNAVADTIFSDDGEAGTNRISRVSQWGPAFQALMDHPKIVPYLIELLGGLLGLALTQELLHRLGLGIDVGQDLRLAIVHLKTQQLDVGISRLEPLQVFFGNHGVAKMHCSWRRGNVIATP